jgi:hypothetical protein
MLLLYFSVLVGIPGRLYATTTDPIVSGSWITPGTACRSSVVSGVSEAPKSTVFAANSLSPSPLSRLESRNVRPIYLF